MAVTGLLARGVMALNPSAAAPCEVGFTLNGMAAGRVKTCRGIHVVVIRAGVPGLRTEEAS